MGRWVICVVLVLGAGLAAMPAAADDTVDEFAAADAHALAAPESVATSVSALSAYLVESAQNDRDKARAIFRWITLNVAYDVSARADSRDAEIVLSRRRVICYGYAVLFKALAEASGLEAEVVIGHSKRSAPDLLEEPDARPNHAWNAVRISGEWQLVDSCWGAGYLDEHRRFVPSFNAHYFLTPPEVFVYDHFPLDPGRQLLDPPISEDEYLRRVHVRPPFFDCGLRLVSHQSAVIDADESLTVTIGAPAETLLTAALYLDGWDLQDGCTFAQRDADGVVVRARFPTAGAYVLRIFARRQDAPGNEYAWALDYAVRARSGAQSEGGFPRVYQSFLARNCRLDGALSRTLPAGEPVEFSLTVPGAEDVVVATGGSLRRLPADGSRFTGEVPVSPGPVVVFARFAGGPAYEGLLQYTGR